MKMSNQFANEICIITLDLTPSQYIEIEKALYDRAWMYKKEGSMEQYHSSMHTLAQITVMKKANQVLTKNK